MEWTRDAFGVTGPSTGFTIQAVDFDRKEETQQFEGLPDECPRCHAKGTPSAWGKHASISPDAVMRIVLKCPNRECGRLFFAVYRIGYKSSAWGESYGYLLNDTEPLEFEPYDFGAHVEAVSPRFCKIMNQALQAEEYHLDEIAGPGYRKALEVLIKDFAKLPYEAQLKKAKKESDAAAEAQAENHLAEIESLFLVPCIKQYIDDKRIKDIAERAAWLGNDETHYVRKWPEKDIKALKALIELVIHFVRSHLEYAAVLEDMPEGRK